MNKLLVVGIIVVVVLLGLWAFVTYRGTSPTPQVQESTEQVSEPRQIVVNLEEQNESGVSGTASLVESEEGLWVILNLEGAPENAAQPAHIHRNTCEEIGAVLYPLEFPVNGFSQTLLPLTPEELMADLPLSINIHKSAEEAQIYVACGNI